LGAVSGFQHIFSGVEGIGWLLLLFVTGTLTGTVMRIYQDQLAAVVVLSVFIPLLVGTGGNAGSQTTATIIRALAVGDIALKDSLRVLWHELRTAIILGLMLSAVAYVRAITWGTTPLVAAVVSLSIIAIVIWADSVGSMLPLLAARRKMAPALVSGPLMSTWWTPRAVDLFHNRRGVAADLGCETTWENERAPANAGALLFLWVGEGLLRT
jgi:Mg/Co/Ni transporter MgtE